MNINDKCHALHFIVERSRMLGHTCAIGHLTTIWYWDEMVDEKKTAVLNFDRDRQASTGKVVEVNASGPVYDTLCNRGMLAGHPNGAIVPQWPLPRPSFVSGIFPPTSLTKRYHPVCKLLSQIMGSIPSLAT